MQDRTPPTVQELFDVYMRQHLRPHCRSWRSIQYKFEQYLIGIAPEPAESLKLFHVKQLHTSIGERVGKTAANNAVQILRALYNKAIAWELIECRNPVVGVKLYRLQSRDRYFLDKAELLRFAEAMQTLRYDAARDFLWLCLFTAARRSNVAAMRWDEINLEQRTWRIPETKNGTPQIVPLVSLAVELLTLRTQSATSVWVFPSTRSKSGHLTKPEKAWKMLIERAGLQNARIHDLRRTLASYEAITGANISVISQTLNHKDLKSTAIYARLQIDPVRKAMEIATAEMFPTAQCETVSPPPAEMKEQEPVDLGFGAPNFGKRELIFDRDRVERSDDPPVDPWWEYRLLKNRSRRQENSEVVTDSDATSWEYARSAPFHQACGASASSRGC